MDTPEEARRAKLRSRLDSSRAETLTVLQQLTIEQLDLPVHSEEAGGWRVKDLVAHLASAEAGHCQVARALMEGRSTRYEGFELDAYNRRETERRARLTLAELLAELANNRRETYALLDAVPGDSWQISGWHPGGFDVTVEGVFKVIALHEMNHLRELKRALLRAAAA